MTNDELLLVIQGILISFGVNPGVAPHVAWTIFDTITKHMINKCVEE